MVSIGRSSKEEQFLEDKINGLETFLSTFKSIANENIFIWDDYDYYNYEAHGSADTFESRSTFNKEKNVL